MTISALRMMYRPSVTLRRGKVSLPLSVSANGLILRRNSTTTAPAVSLWNSTIPSQHFVQQQSRYQQTRRWQSSSSPKGPQPRQRFYKHVGVIPVEAPWEEPPTKPNDERTTVDSPISAGVDGTQSASGVIGPAAVDTEETPSDRATRLRPMLLPRRPTTSSSETNCHRQWYAVTLDGRTLKTPFGQGLAVPSQLLAWAIAAEWDSQKTQIQPVQMPLMTLTCTALDQTAVHPDHYRQTALQYLPTDTTCYWADPAEDRVMHKRQDRAWKELHHFIEIQFDEKPAMALGAQEGMLLLRRNGDTGSIGLPHPTPLMDACVDWTRNLDAWHLTALNAVAAETKSFLVAYAVLHPESPFSSLSSSSSPGSKDITMKAVQAARVEEEFQIESWGLVEGQHDYDRLNCKVQVRSAKVLTTLLLDGIE